MSLLPMHHHHHHHHLWSTPLLLTLSRQTPVLTSLIKPDLRLSPQPLQLTTTPGMQPLKTLLPSLSLFVFVQVKSVGTLLPRPASSTSMGITSSLTTIPSPIRMSFLPVLTLTLFKIAGQCTRASNRRSLGDLHATIFDQADNLPTTEDGPTLFKKLTALTMVASLQLSVLSFKMILEFDPVVHKFHIPTINTMLNHLFVLATTCERTLQLLERILHTITAYSRIKQPEQWAQWIRNQVDDFEAGTLTICQDFMNSAVIKYNKVSGSNDGSFSGAATTLQEDIVAMVAAVKHKAPTPHAAVQAKPKHNTSPPDAKGNKMPPFLRHYKSSISPGSVTYKVGDSKPFDGATWYFCDYPNHHNHIKWHTHTPADCRTRINWLANKTSGKPVANAAEIDNNQDSILPDSAADSVSNDITGLLASAMNMVGDNPVASDLIADALNAVHDNI
jgi:hypothetical protein